MKYVIRKSGRGIQPPLYVGRDDDLIPDVNEAVQFENAAAAARALARRFLFHHIAKEDCFLYTVRPVRAVTVDTSVEEVQL